jgi:hypothetical protein
MAAYNILTPGRERPPFLDEADPAYNVSLLSIDQLAASTTLGRPKAPDEFRVVLVGDSFTWGYLLRPEQSLAACFNRLNATTPDGRRLVAYNLGYPKLTATKDLLFLRRALRYDADLIIWQFTLASLYPADQLDHLIVGAHYDEVNALAAAYAIDYSQNPPGNPYFEPPGLLDRTFFGQRRPLADWVRNQLTGVAWAAAGFDHEHTQLLTPNPTQLLPNEDFLTPNPLRLRAQGQLSADDLALDVLAAGVRMAGEAGVPILMINEPTYQQVGDPLRWNYYYPRWGYAAYLEVMQAYAQNAGWDYLDWHGAVLYTQYTNTALHVTAPANCAYAARLAEESARRAR